MRNSQCFLLYFGYTDSVERDTGGTQICKINNQNLNDHETINENDFDVIYDIKPKNNNFAGFEVSDNSWHCVLPIEQLPDKVERVNLQINLMRCNHYSFLLKCYRKIANLIRT